jgi:myosin heavy subunit
MCGSCVPSRFSVASCVVGPGGGFFGKGKRRSQKRRDEEREMLADEEIWRGQPVWVWESNNSGGSSNDQSQWIPGVVQSLHIDGTSHTFSIKIGETTLMVTEDAPEGDGAEYIRFKKRQAAMNPDSCTDMTLLLNLNEPEIIECLKLRFAKKLIYTSIGPILVAVNPFERLNLYEPMIDQYFGKSTEAARQLGPHIYQLSEVAYQKMFIDKFNPDKRENQSILVNGESGAGKTESTKQVLRYLTNVSASVARALRVAGVDIPDDDFEKMIIAANPITESFGNAKTSRNNNSSRFGKFIELNYSADGYIEGASITTYLLETVRLVRQSKGERNYHIFYEIFRGLSANTREGWALHSLSDFLYTNQSDEFDRHDGERDEDNFVALSNALSQCGLSEEQKSEVFGVVVGILHLGNLSFCGASNNGVDVSPNSDAHIQKVGELLGVQREDLVSAVTKKKVVIARSEIMKELDEVNAMAARDSFSKILYDLLFKWLIQRVNVSMKCSVETRASFIGVLDIFGFEYFPHNSFEQLW